MPRAQNPQGGTGPGGHQHYDLAAELVDTFMDVSGNTRSVHTLRRTVFKVQGCEPTRRVGRLALESPVKFWDGPSTDPWLQV
eukprot:15461409-Alexandrium_andersonii.AAC.1